MTALSDIAQHARNLAAGLPAPVERSRRRSPIIRPAEEEREIVTTLRTYAREHHGEEIAARLVITFAGTRVRVELPSPKPPAPGRTLAAALREQAAMERRYGIETRTAVVAPALPSVRASRESTPPSPKLDGYAIVWGARSLDLGGFHEVIRRSAVEQSLRRRGDVLALVGHDSNAVLGRTTSRTLSLHSDTTGLRATIVPPATSYARDLMESVQRGDTQGFSFGFKVLEACWPPLEDPDDLPTRAVTDMVLIEVSPTALPAHPQTSIAVRGLPLRVVEALRQLDAAMARG